MKSTKSKKIKKKHFRKKKREIVIFGIGKFGKHIIEAISHLPEYKIIAVDKDENKLKSLPTNISELVVGDATTEAFIEELGVENIEIFVISMSNIQASLITTVLLRQKYPKARIIAKASTDEHEHILHELGVKELINTEKAGAKRAVVKILNPFLEIKSNTKIWNIQELEGGMSLIRVDAPEKFINKKIKDLKIPRDVTIVLVYRNLKPKVVYGEFVFQSEDELLILAENDVMMNYIYSGFSEKSN